MFRGEITELQQLGCERYIFAYFLLRSKRMRIPVSNLAYTLATVYHETAFKMQPVEEYGKGLVTITESLTPKQVRHTMDVAMSRLRGATTMKS